MLVECDSNDFYGYVLLVLFATVFTLQRRHDVENTVRALQGKIRVNVI